MPKIISDYHTHTVMGHGTDTARDNIEAALSLGLGKIGIADHAPGYLFWGIRDMELYLSELEHLREEYQERIQVKAGIEINLCGLAGQTDMPEGYEDSMDIVILTFHWAARMADFRSSLHFYQLGGTGSQHIARSTDAYLAALEKHRVDILVHPAKSIQVDLAALAQGCAQQGTLLELNSAHADLPEKEIEKTAKQGVKFVLNSNAHASKQVGQVDGVLKKALRIGLGKEQIISLA